MSPSLLSLQTNNTRAQVCLGTNHSPHFTKGARSRKCFSVISHSRTLDLEAPDDMGGGGESGESVVALWAEAFWFLITDPATRRFGGGYLEGYGYLDATGGLLYRGGFDGFNTASTVPGRWGTVSGSNISSAGEGQYLGGSHGGGMMFYGNVPDGQVSRNTHANGVRIFVGDLADTGDMGEEDEEEEERHQIRRLSQQQGQAAAGGVPGVLVTRPLLPTSMPTTSGLW